MNTRIPFRRRKQEGLTLVELMVAMLIGLLVLLVVGQIYLSGRQSYRTQTGFGGMQENGRFALFFLQRDIRLAGFPYEQGPGGAVSAETIGFNTTGTLDGGSGGSDEIEVQYHSFGIVLPDMDSLPADTALRNQVTENNTFEGSGRDCLGNLVPAVDGGATVINRYRVEGGDLRCEGNGGGTAQPIVSGVESMQILYGVDTDADNADPALDRDRVANVYRRADQVSDWSKVVTVRIGLLLNSLEPVYETPDTNWYAVLDAAPVQATDDPATPLDERLFARRVFVTTIMIRNRTEDV